MNITRDQVRQLVANIFEDVAAQLDALGVIGDDKWRALRAAAPQIEQSVVDHITVVYRAEIEADGAPKH